ncbi:MAG: GWxTD domain-containing protein [Vicinamibacteria bacterium]
MIARRPLSLALLAVVIAAVPSAWAGLDKEAKAWLEGVAPLILSDEEKTYKDLKDKSDRDEFQRIFWARRNPKGPTATENPYKAEYEKAKAEADKRYRVRGRPGSETDCGRTFILLGDPADVKKEKTQEQTEPGMRSAETWTYKGPRFKGGEAHFAFDGECMVGPDFVRAAASLAQDKVISPNIAAKVGSDGHLTKLADLLPKPTPAQALLKDPRQDFPLEAGAGMVLRGKDGSSYLGGLLRAAAPGFTPQDMGGKKVVPLVVAAEALDESGSVMASVEREANAEVDADGSLIASYGMALKAGKYTIRVGALDSKTGKGSAASYPIEMPDFSTGQLTVSDLLVLHDIQTGVKSDPKGALDAFTIGGTQVIPRFTHVFAKTETVDLLAFAYDAQVDAAGKTQVVSQFTVMKDGKRFTGSAEQAFDTPIAAPEAGPVPLSDFAPGKYVVQLKVTDKLAGKELMREAAFEVK